ncbi:MAG: hypothetical protein EPO35_10355 [Acidobacteria bacterium]|nr:MAG: hypothetical protein EPO35_10355 [Acidobacteriota bacterium]
MELTNADIDAGFAQVRRERALHRRLDDVRNPDFWRRLNPELSITDFPLRRAARRAAPPAAVLDRCRRQLLADGYLHVPSLVPRDEAERLAAAVTRIVNDGLPAELTAVYDEAYRIFAGLEAVFEPLLGPGYFMVTQGVGAFYVPPADDGRSLWTASAPHRDRMAPDARTMAGEVPSILTLWLALSDVTTEHSCLYVVPASADPDFHTPERKVGDTFRLQDIRALPAQTGDVIGWSSHLIHWGSASSRFVTTPRISITMYFQRRDVPLWHPFHIDPEQPCTFAERLTWIEHSLGRAGLFDGIKVEGA